MTCKSCGSGKLTSVAAKVADMCATTDLDTDTDMDGYADANPRLRPIQSGGDYLEFTFCADCGTIQELAPEKRG